MLGLSVLALFDGLFSAAIGQIVFFYGSKTHLNNDLKFRLSQYTMRTNFISLVFIILTTVYIFITPQSSTFNFTFIFTLLACLFYFTNEPPRSALISLLNLEGTRKVFALQIVIDSSVTFIITFLFLKFNGSWVSVILAILISRYISTKITYAILKFTKILNSNIKERNLSKGDYKRVSLDILPIVLMGGLGWINSYADRFIIASSINVRDAGFLSLANGLVGKPYNITTSSLTMTYRPSLFKSENLKSRILKNWLLAALGIGFVGAVLFFFLGTSITKIMLSATYTQSITPLLPILALSYTFAIGTHVFDNLFLAEGKGKTLLIVQSILAPITLFFVFVGAYYGGLIGAVWARVAGDFLRLITTGFSVKLLSK